MIGRTYFLRERDDFDWSLLSVWRMRMRFLEALVCAGDVGFLGGFAFAICIYLSYVLKLEQVSKMLTFDDHRRHALVIASDRRSAFAELYAGRWLADHPALSTRLDRTYHIEIKLRCQSKSLSNYPKV